MRNDPVADGEDSEEVERASIADAPIVEGYTIERELGRGGEAIVYLAREHALNRLVALKVLLPERAASIHADRFVQEIALIARLTHTNILPLHSAGRAANGVLFYTARFVEGESLRARIAREKQLAIPEAVRIAREVASALDYACRNGVVHRDIKPENVLLGDGHAIVADFGVARAVNRASDHRLTAPGLAVGTVLYASPEQAGGEAEIDGRSDIYSLGCVLYEMLIGAPPFHGSSALDIIAHHMTSPVPSLRDVRPTVTKALEDVVMRALAKTPADRFDTAAAFDTALERAVAGQTSWHDQVQGMARRVRAHPAVAAIGGVALLTAGAVWLGANAPANAGETQGQWGTGVNTADSTWLQLAVLPVDGSDTAVRHPVGRHMRDALKRWSDVAVENELEVAEALGRWRAPLGIEDARRVATSVGAGRFIRIGADRIGDSLDVSASLHETASGLPWVDARVRVAADLVNAQPAFATLAEALLLPGRSRHHRTERSEGTSSLRARTAYLAGHRAVEEWDLPLADSLFELATRFDGQYAHALLWLAQVRNWRGRPVPLWQSAAVRAHARRAQLDAADTLASDALLAFAEGRIPEACDRWRDATTIHSGDFAAWYGYANCLRRDDAVVRDSMQPTGWRFRSSYNSALDAYRRAFQLLPSVGAFKQIAFLLKTQSTQIRGGWALPPETLEFLAYPSVDADSIVFVPFAATDFYAARPGVWTEGVNAATARYRRLHRDIAVAWRAMSPSSSDALEAVAMSLDLYGDPAALDTLRLARRMARQPDDQVRLAALEVWVRVKAAIPDDRRGLLRARVLADSLLAANPPATASEPHLLSGLAALLGRATLAAEYARTEASRDEAGIHGALGESAAALRAFASLGGPPERIAGLEQALNATIASNKQSGDTAEARATMVRAATLAFPDHRMQSLTEADTAGDYLVTMLNALLRQDSAGARGRLAYIEEQRRTVHPSDLTFDALYPEAAVFARLGDAAGAVRWLDPTLDHIAQVAVQILADAEGARAGPLVRAVALRADVANSLGDRRTARRYAGAVTVLWADADPFLEPTVRRMRVLAR